MLRRSLSEGCAPGDRWTASPRAPTCAIGARRLCGTLGLHALSSEDGVRAIFCMAKCEPPSGIERPAEVQYYSAGCDLRCFSTRHLCSIPERANVATIRRRADPNAPTNCQR